jgi:glucose/arabinose dehydrogenase
MKGVRTALIAVALMAPVGCSKAPPSPPQMTPTEPVTVTGREHLAWDQLAASATELQTIGFNIYVDNAPAARLTGVACTSTATPGSFECKAPLPKMLPGDHTLGVTAFYEDNPAAESGRAGPLRLIVTASATPASAGGSPASASVPRAAAARHERPSTDVPGWPPTAVRVADGLDRPADLAFTPDARLWVAERSGRVRVVQDGSIAAEPALNFGRRADGTGEVIAIAADPQFARTHFIYAIYTALSRANRLTFTLARFREATNTLADTVVILDEVPASADARASLRFGPDGKLYAAFDDGGDARLSEDMASFNGKILRLNSDGTTPDDAARKSPIFMSGFGSPRGLAWDRKTGRLWAADERYVGSVRWTTAPIAIAALEDDLFVGSDLGLVRGRIDRRNPARLTGTEDVIHHVPVHAVVAGPDGALYFATATALGRLQ